jgi:RNA polymerase sigma-70 factor (ECF subfamily)
MQDAELVRLARAGRPEAYADLVRRWAARVTALCHARVGRADVAEDLAQETLLRGYRALGTLSDPERFGPWLCGIALRTCLDWLRSRQHAPIPFSALGSDGEGFDQGRQDEPALDHDDDRRQLLREIDSLPETYRQVILLYYYEDHTYRDLGRLLGISPATVNARLTKARALLRQRLGRCMR